MLIFYYKKLSKLISRSTFHKLGKITVLAVIFTSLPVAESASGQNVGMTLSEAIALAQERSYESQVAKLEFISQYWTYRAFKAELLPSINLTGSLMNFDRSMVEARNSDDGKISYVENNSLTNSLQLSIDQNIPALGGTLSVQSYLYRLDQFSYDITTYNSQPFRISYTQPLRSYNELRWRQKTEPLEYEKAKKEYLEAMENVAVNTATLFFSVLSAQSTHKENVTNFNDRTRLMGQAEKRLKLGTLTKNDVLQLELSMINAKVAMRQSELDLNDCLFNLFSYLHIIDYDKIELISPLSIPEIEMDMQKVIDMAMANSSHTLEQRLNVLESEQELASAKSQRGIQLELNSEIGVNRTTNKFADAYRGLQDNEIVGLTLSMPLFDWGVSKGKVKVAKANLEVTKTKVEQANMEFLQDVKKKVMQFSCQGEQCKSAERALDIAEERYEIMKKRFENGSVNVTELNTAQQEQESARTQFVGQLEAFWTYYYSLRKLTLHDFIMKRDLDVNFKDLIK